MKERMVTRTVKQAKVELMTVNTKTKEVSTKEIYISASIPEDKILKYISKNIELENGEKVVDFTGREVSEVLYGMSEQEFISLAKVLPPRTGEKEEIPEEKPKKTPKKNS